LDRVIDKQKIWEKQIYLTEMQGRGCIPDFVKKTSWCCGWKGWLCRDGGASAQKSCKSNSHILHLCLFPAPYSLHPLQVKR